MELNVSDFSTLKPYMLKKSGKPTAIMFKASYCGHCKQMQGVWNEVRNKILFVNVHTFTSDSSPDKQAHIDRINNTLELGQINGYPTFIFYDSNGKISKMEGSGISFNEFLEKCKTLI